MPQHLYLHTLEIDRLEIGQEYNPLPSHLTLISRFLTDLSAVELTEIVSPVFVGQAAVELQFEAAIELGVKRTPAHMVYKTEAMQHLHDELRAVLAAHGVRFTQPDFIGDGWRPHVSKRPNDDIKAGQTINCLAAYLIEVDKRPDGSFRRPQARFDLG